MQGSPRHAAHANLLHDGTRVRDRKQQRSFSSESRGRWHGSHHPSVRGNRRGTELTAKSAAASNLQASPRIIWVQQRSAVEDGLAGILLAIAAAGLQFALAAWTGPASAPFMLLLVAITAAPLLFGRVGGLACLIASAPFAAAFFVRPDGNALPTRDEAITLLLFLLVGWVVVEVGSSLRKAWLETKRVEQELAENLSAFREFVDHLPMPVWTTSGNGGGVYFNDEWSRITGIADDDRGFGGLLELVHPEDQESVKQAWASSLSTGSEFSAVFRLNAPGRGYRWQLARSRPLRDRRGSIKIWCGACVDVHDPKTAEEREVMLSRELDHRTKNMLAIIQSILRMTQANDTATFRDAVSGRVRALAAAHDLLSASRSGGADLNELAHAELAALSPSSSAYALAGPSLQLSREMAQGLTLVLHELATNARKYGALSVAGGQVAVSWSLQGQDPVQLFLRWEEKGGPPVHRPEREGFGSTLIRSTVLRQLQGELEFSWKREGLCCQLIVPLPACCPPPRGAAREP